MLVIVIVYPSSFCCLWDSACPSFPHFRGNLNHQLSSDVNAFPIRSKFRVHFKKNLMLCSDIIRKSTDARTVSSDKALTECSVGRFLLRFSPGVKSFGRGLRIASRHAPSSSLISCISMCFFTRPPAALNPSPVDLPSCSGLSACMCLLALVGILCETCQSSCDRFALIWCGFGVLSHGPRPPTRCSTGTPN